MQTGDIRWDAADYGKHSQAQYQWAQELIAGLHLRGCEAVLDIGCGDGKVTKGIADRLPHGYVIGVDRSGNMIESARKRYSGQAFRNLIFRKMDVRDFHDAILKGNSIPIEMVRAALKGVELPRDFKSEWRFYE